MLKVILLAAGCLLLARVCAVDFQAMPQVQEHGTSVTLHSPLQPPSLLIDSRVDKRLDCETSRSMSAPVTCLHFMQGVEASLNAWSAAQEDSEATTWYGSQYQLKSD